MTCGTWDAPQREHQPIHDQAWVKYVMPIRAHSRSMSIGEETNAYDCLNNDHFPVSTVDDRRQISLPDQYVDLPKMDPELFGDLEPLTTTSIYSSGADYSVLTTPTGVPYFDSQSLSEQYTSFRETAGDYQSNWKGPHLLYEFEAPGSPFVEDMSWPKWQSTIIQSQTHNLPWLGQDVEYVQDSLTMPPSEYTLQLPSSTPEYSIDTSVAPRYSSTVPAIAQATSRPVITLSTQDFVQSFLGKSPQQSTIAVAQEHKFVPVTVGNGAPTLTPTTNGSSTPSTLSPSSMVGRPARDQDLENASAPTTPLLDRSLSELYPFAMPRDDANIIILQGRSESLGYAQIREHIRQQTQVDLAESTIRGRFRTLTVRPQDRARRVKWTSKDVSLLERAVRAQCRSQFRLQNLRTEQDLNELHIRWRDVADFIQPRNADGAGTRRFDGATCKKKFMEVHHISRDHEMSRRKRR